MSKCAFPVIRFPIALQDGRCAGLAAIRPHHLKRYAETQPKYHIQKNCRSCNHQIKVDNHINDRSETVQVIVNEFRFKSKKAKLVGKEIAHRYQGTNKKEYDSTFYSLRQEIQFLVAQNETLKGYLEGLKL